MNEMITLIITGMGAYFTKLGHRKESAVCNPEDSSQIPNLPAPLSWTPQTLEI
jgi:hypothetical protein